MPEIKNTILVVDDAPEVIDLFAEALRPFFRVKFALDGFKALELAVNQPPDLILLDVMMPGMSGHEVCDRLKADLRTKEIPVIFITASNNLEEEQRGLELGAVDYIHKPVSLALVLQRVRIHLALRNQNLALETQVAERTRQLEATQLEIIRRLSMAGE